jgi:hypothetical protein
MPTGETTSGGLANALPTVFAEARSIREQKSGTWERVTTVKRQNEGEGYDFNWFTLNQLDDASGISENQSNNTFQQFVGSVQNTAPEMTQVIIKVTDRSYRKVSKNVTGKFGPMAGYAMARKKNKDFLSLALTFATTASPGSGQPMGSSYISAAARLATSNVTEPAMTAINTVLHGFQIYDLHVEQVAAIGTYAIPAGMTEQVFRNGFRGQVAGSMVFEDGNIAIDSTPNANGATLAREGVYSIMGMTLKRETDRDPYFGGGADVIILTDEYAFAENKSGAAGTTQVFCYRHQSDATAPTG